MIQDPVSPIQEPIQDHTQPPVSPIQQPMQQEPMEVVEELVDIHVANRVFTVRKYAIMKSNLINDMINDDDQDQIFVQANPDHFEKVVEFLELSYENKPTEDLVNNIIKLPANGEFYTPEEKKYIAEILETCNYLIVEDMLKTLCKRFGTIINDSLEKSFYDTVKLIDYEYWDKRCKV